jgi:hypothetical protein
MATTQARAWTFTTGGFPAAMKLSTITPPKKDEIKPKHILVKIKAAGLSVTLSLVSRRAMLTVSEIPSMSKS